VFQSTSYGTTSDVVLGVNATAAEQGDLATTANIQSFLGLGTASVDATTAPAPP
jgi:hypothetical protein